MRPVKRKRSDSELSSPPSAFSRVSPPAHLGGRTLKRFRDGRPSEEDIHKSTLNILFSAQRNRSLSPAPLSDSPSITPPSSTPSVETPIDAAFAQEYGLPLEPSQPSLHRFWGKLPSTGSSAPTPPPAPTAAGRSAAGAYSHNAMPDQGHLHAQLLQVHARQMQREMQEHPGRERCEDCGAGLVLAVSDAMVMDMDFDMDGVACARRMCPSCTGADDDAVGTGARSARHASGGRRVWVAGVGWVSEGVVTC